MVKKTLKTVKLTPKNLDQAVEALSDNLVKAKAKVMARVYESEGVSVTDALGSLNVPNARGISVISVSKGGKAKDRILGVVETLRLFNKNPKVREAALKTLIPAFNEIS